MPILSELFESEKGAYVYGKRTICEVHRNIFDKLVIGLAESAPALLHDLVPLLEEAYLMGIKMNAKLVQHKDEWSAPNADREALAEQRARRAEILKANLEVLARFAKPERTDDPGVAP